MAITTQIFQSDARPSGQTRYRGELWLVKDEEWRLVYVTPRQYVSVEDARDAAAAYITEYQRTGARRTRV